MKLLLPVFVSAELLPLFVLAFELVVIVLWTGLGGGSLGTTSRCLYRLTVFSIADLIFARLITAALAFLPRLLLLISERSTN